MRADASGGRNATGQAGDDSVVAQTTSEAEVAALRDRLAEAEQTLDAIRNGDVDAVVVGGPSGQHVYTLENADRPYRVLIEQMQEGAITLGSDGTVLYCNQRFATLVDTPRETILSRNVATFLDASANAAFFGMVANGAGAPAAGEFVLQAGNGLQVPVRISIVGLQVDDEAPRVICGVVTDLTQTQRRAGELASTNARLAAEIDDRQRAEDSLRLALDAAGMGNWEMDIASGRVERSLRHDQIFGHDIPPAGWSFDDAIRQVVPDDRNAVSAAFASAREGGELAFECRIVRAGDEAVRWIDVRGRTYYDAGRPVRIAGVVSDVTERREVEEQLRQAQKMEAVGQLTGGIAHDFNNLLLVIGGSLDLLGRRIPVDERTTRLLTAARSGVARGAKLNQQLLAFSRRQDLRADVVCVDELVPAFEQLLERAVGEAVAIDIHRVPELWLCRTDPYQLETAILNLAINARDAMPDGGSLTLRTANRVVDAQAAARAGASAGEYVVVSVRDTGSGMPPEVVARAFEPFFTTKEIGKGTGLGLSQVYGFAKQSGGFVTIDSGTGRGTTVSIHLPRTQRERTTVAPVEAAPPPAVEQGQGTILLVEDDADVRATAAAMLLDLGYQVREANTARAALVAADDGGIDLVFSDVIMPDGMSGIDLARELGRRPAPPPMLLTSGYTAQRVIPEELAHRLLLLRKPYTQLELAKAVIEALRAAVVIDPAGARSEKEAPTSAAAVDRQPPAAAATETA